MMSVWSSLVGQDAAVAKLSEAAASARAIVASRGGARASDDARSMSHAWLIERASSRAAEPALEATIARALAAASLSLATASPCVLVTATLLHLSRMLV